MNEIFNMTISELCHAIKQKHFSIENLVCAYLRRIEKYDGVNGLNTVCEINRDAVEQARRMDLADNTDNAALFGIPILIKDNIDVKGLHTTAGSLALADNVAACDADVVKNLKRSGAIILGKTNLTEFANYTGQNMPNGYSSRGGQVKNAYHRGGDPGGSSSGSAVAVSAGFCAAAVGTDTSFSIVACATYNGVTGFKPPFGALSQNGIIPISKTLDSAGPLTRDLNDALIVYSCMRDEPILTIEKMQPNQLHIAVNAYNCDSVSESQLSKYSAILEAVRRDGGCVSEITQQYMPHQKSIMRCEFREELERYLSRSSAKRKTLRTIIDFYEAHSESMKYGISYLLDAVASGADDELYATAIAERANMRAAVLRELREFDACLMTGPTNIMHFCGLPSVAIRIGMGDDCMPRGMILYGADERRLLSAALTLEQYCAPTETPQLIRSAG
jgi:amidase